MLCNAHNIDELITVTHRTLYLVGKPQFFLHFGIGISPAQHEHEIVENFIFIRVLVKRSSKYGKEVKLPANRYILTAGLE